MFSVMTPDEKLLYHFFLGTGCRDHEVTFASWADINFQKQTYTVRSKPEVGFFVKNHESRTVRLPDRLIADLKAHKEKAHERWIFSSKGQAANHSLRRLKKIALRAGLNCGTCKTTVQKGSYYKEQSVAVSCRTDPVCEHIYLHRLRKTAATRWLEAGKISVRTNPRCSGFWPRRN